MKYLLFLLVSVAVGCGPNRSPKKVYCLDLPEGVVTSTQYFGLGGWGNIEVFSDGHATSTSLSGSYWFNNLRTSDTITHNKQP